jgi:hypothetical protein
MGFSELVIHFIRRNVTKIHSSTPGIIFSKGSRKRKWVFSKTGGVGLDTEVFHEGS